MNEAKLSDEQWEVIEPLLPPQPRTGRRRQHDREVLNSLVYRRLGQNGRYRACPLVTGSRYRDLPRTPEYAASASVVVNAGRRGRTPSSTQSARSAGWWSGSTPGMTTTEDSSFDMTAKPLTTAPMLSSPLSSCVLDVCLPLLTMHSWTGSRLKLCLLAKNPQLKQAVAEKLEFNWSPEQISGWLSSTLHVFVG